LVSEAHTADVLVGQPEARGGNDEPAVILHKKIIGRRTKAEIDAICLDFDVTGRKTNLVTQRLRDHHTTS
jgi:hypothetical protein